MSVSVSVGIGGRAFVARLDRPTPIAVPLDFHGDQPNAFFLPAAHAEAARIGSFVGDTRLGGPVNCETITLCPHGNGTHTECVGHVVHDRVAISSVLRGGLFTATLVTVAETSLEASGDSYPNPCAETDSVVSATALDRAVAAVAGGDATDALVVRVLGSHLPDSVTTWSGNAPTYFTREAMERIAAGPWQHLVTELPSADRDDDDGALVNHRLWWGLGPEQVALDGRAPSSRTITEMAWVPRDVPDGLWALGIELPAFLSDAAPSRPVLYPLTPAE